MLSTPRDSELSTFKALVVTPPSCSVLSTSALHKHRARRELPGCEAGHRGLLRCWEAWISVGGNGESWEGCELGQGVQVWLSAPAPVLQRVDSLTLAARQCLPGHPEPALSLSSTPAQAVRGAWGQPRGARTPELALEGLRRPWAEVEQELLPGPHLGGPWAACGRLVSLSTWHVSPPSPVTSSPTEGTKDVFPDVVQPTFPGPPTASALSPRIRIQQPTAAPTSAPGRSLGNRGPSWPPGAPQPKVGPRWRPCPPSLRCQLLIKAAQSGGPTPQVLAQGQG